jgi:hypothetical protein
MGVSREARKKPTNFRFAHLRRVSFIVKKDKPLDSMNIRLLCSVAIVPRANRLPHLVEQSRFLSCYKHLDASFEIQSAVDYSKRTIGRLVRVDVIHNALLVVRLSSHSFSPRIYEGWQGTDAFEPEMLLVSSRLLRTITALAK